jgi:hypothetical protein
MKKVKSLRKVRKDVEGVRMVESLRKVEGVKEAGV